MKDSEGYEIKAYRRVWFVEIGWVDGGGMGYWAGTKESIPLKSHKECLDLRDKWEKEGKLKRMHWGELRPTGLSYGTFRIREEQQPVNLKEGVIDG